MNKIKRILSLCMIVILLCAGVVSETAFTEAAVAENTDEMVNVTEPAQEDVYETWDATERILEDAYETSNATVLTQEEIDAGVSYPSATEDYTPGITVLEEPEVFSVEGDHVLIGSGQKEAGIAPLGLLMDNITVKAVERVDTFANANSTPMITTSIKYIDDDGEYGDSRDADGSIRWRYVYCIEHEKDPPVNKVLTWDNWENRYVNHIMYYGAAYYYETARKASHSTGNWRYDYLATHMAICVATGQYTLAQVTASIRKSPASSTDEELLITAITNMVNDAYAANGLTGWDADGWFRMDSGYTSFQLSAAAKTWTLGSDGYYYSGWITPVLTTIGGYYANSDITSLTNTVTSGVSIEKKYTDSIHSPYRLKISKKQFADWQTTGKTITSAVTIRVPSHWGAATYTAGNSSLQDVCLLSYSTVNQYTTFSKSISFTIPKSIHFQLTKVRSGTTQVIPGAVFSYTAPDGTVKRLTTNAKGMISVSDLAAGVHTFQEIQAPEGLQTNANKIQFTVSQSKAVTVTSAKVDSVSVTTDTTGNVIATMEDEVSEYGLQIAKVNDAGKNLAGVAFTLYSDSACKDVVETQKTNENGILQFSSLTPGKNYYLKETQTLPGYSLPEETVKLYAETDPIQGKFRFWVNDEMYSEEDTDSAAGIYLSGTASQRIIHMQIMNRRGMELPNSGSHGTVIWMLTGILCMGGVLLSRKRQEERYEKMESET